MPADQARLVQRRRGLRHDFGRLAARRVDRDHAPARRALRGLEVEPSVHRAQEIVEAVPLVQQADDRRTGIREVPEVHGIAVEAVGDDELQPAPVVSDDAVGVVAVVVGDRVDLRIGGLRSAEPVTVHAHLPVVVALAVRAFRVARVVERARIGQPGHAGELGVADELR